MRQRRVMAIMMAGMLCVSTALTGCAKAPGKEQTEAQAMEDVYKRQDQKVEEGALSFAACQAIVSGNAKRIFGLGRKLAVNAEEKTDEKTEEKMVKGDQGWRK